ncbi:MAG: hypothetical protein HC837_13540 [Chloroflexaceae bacterium]|nr:hypothetical protein [Chloroflexaceae bacterium]
MASTHSTTLPGCSIDRMTFSQARGRIISTLLKQYDQEQLARKLAELYPNVAIKEYASARSLASKLAWLLLPERA